MVLDFRTKTKKNKQGYVDQGFPGGREMPSKKPIQFQNNLKWNI